MHSSIPSFQWNTHVVAGITKTAFDVTGFEPSERQKNVIAEIPAKYGNAPKYRFIKGDPVKDIKVVSRKELIQSAGDVGDLPPLSAFWTQL